MLELIAYKTEKGLYYATSEINYMAQRDKIYGNNVKVNGSPIVASEHKNYWYFLEGADTITSITKEIHGGYGAARWELIDKSSAIEGVIVESFPAEEANEWFDDDDHEWFIGKFSEHYKYRNLYRRVQVSLPPKEEEIPFSVDYKGEVKQSLVDNDYASMKVTVLKDNNWAHQGTKEVDLSSIVHYYELEELLTPDLLLHNRPCFLSADNTYEVVRNHIKQHIDPKYARITSDYNFCFTVKKKIAIKPFVRKTEKKKANGRSYASPKFSTQTIDHKEVEVFEMCPSKPYQNYTPIVGFKGESLADLVENMKLYLEELMEVINQPLEECQHCGGTGHTIHKVANMNKR